MTDPKAPRSDRPAEGNTLDRRRFLQYVGAGAGYIVGASAFGGALSQIACVPATSPRAWVHADGLANWTAPPYPVPLIADDTPSSQDRQRLERFEVVDDLVLPEEFQYEVIAQWGDRFGAEGHQVHFGINNDYTGLVPIDGSDDEYWMLVNHEYITGRPFLQAYEEIFGEAPPTLLLEEDTSEYPVHFRGILSVDGVPMPRGYFVILDNADDMAQIPDAVQARLRTLATNALTQLGVSVLRVRRLADGRFEIVADARDHKRITALGRENIAGEPAEHSRFTGPAAYLFDTPPRGTMSNCSGGTTSWGTFMTCEENFHYEAEEAIDPSGRPIAGRPRRYGARADKIGARYLFDNPMPGQFFGHGHLVDPPLDGREYGWVAEVDPTSGHLTKHTALGRFRHENVTLRAETGKPLAAYMGDDRRGGHIWKFVSEGRVEDPTDPATSRLLERGTLYVARFHGDDRYTGEWVPIVPETPLRRPEPEFCFSQHIQVPSRFVGGPVAVGDTDRDNPEIEVETWVSVVESFAEKPFDECTLGDLVRAEGDSPEAIRDATLGVLLMDAYLMANACGGTPSARPEDLEVHPRDQSIYIAFTDATDGSEGSPDSRIFPDSKLETSRQYGAIYRIIEDDNRPEATTFGWGRFVSSGEVAEQGGGFACADNLVFGPADHLWMVTDISTSVQNFPTQRDPADETTRGAKYFPGVFGNNSMFMIPTSGEHAGVPQLFATAPMEAEFCGPTFVEKDGETTLILAIQHPGENDGARTESNPQDEQTHIVHDRDDQPFEQQRTVPIGSNFPHGERNRAPRPAVVCITRKA